MPRITDDDKRSRLERIHLLLKRNPRGLTEAEIADEVNIGRRTVNTYLQDLEFEGKTFKDGIYWFPLVLKESQLRPLDLSPEEAVTLYLGARLLSKQQDKRNEPAETALLKLANALKADAGVGAEIEQAARELAQRPVQKEYQPIFRDIVRGYIYHKKIEITYRPLNWNKSFQTAFSTYLLEPSPIGFTTYLIGHSSIVDKWRAYKLERIESVRLTKEEYALPPDFPGLEILRNAWSIVIGEETVRVVLRFSERVKARVLETRWHPSQQTREDKEKPGFLLWEVQVADTLDLLPWIRSWGADCEVLEPRELREALMREVEKMAQRYGILDLKPDDPIVSRLLRLWGKTSDRDSRSTNFHPAMFHLLDVGYIAQVLLKDPASRRWRFALGHTLGANPDTLHQWLPYFVAMHDIGKISAPFQAKNKYQAERLKSEKFDLGNLNWGGKPYHPAVGQRFVEDKQDGLDVPKGLRDGWRDALDGHHGWFSGVSILDDTKRWLAHEPPEWIEWRRKVSDLLKTVLLLKAPITWPAPPNISGASMTLTGFTVLCDWLGSSAGFAQELPWKDYLVEGPIRAQGIVERAGLLQQSQSAAPTNFKDLFDDLPPPRPLQAAIDEIPDDILAKPCLAIIEAPTGEGKTEAAWALAHRLARAHGSDEIYFALPTMSTSNQMFHRFEAHLQKRLELPASQTQLIHSQAFLMDDNFSISLAVDDDGSRQKRAAQKWIKSDKRKALLMPFGVGTIDQAELAALNVPFVALRLMGLAGKVVIFDEVHAYDTYMTTIVEHLLKWLSSLGASVILLSATLPQAQRNSLAQAYDAPLDVNDKRLLTYPCLLVVNQTDQPHIVNPGVSQPNRVIELDKQTLRFGDDEVDGKVNWLLNAVEERGCACWITNTVERAQKLFERLLEVAPADVALSLLHASLPLDERLKRESNLENLYGPKGERPKKGIVVGTQVLEQSLDLDFDVMASDLAPIDFILQRAGRMHRHAGRERGAHSTPRLFLNLQWQDDELDLLDADKWIYGEYLLRQTWNALQNRTTINLPHDYRDLIEKIYSAPEPPPEHPLRNAWLTMDKDRTSAEAEANIHLSPECHADYSFCDNDGSLRQIEDENDSSWFAAKTRREADSVTVIPLERVGSNRVRVVTAEEGTFELDLNAVASKEQENKILRRGVRISRKAIVPELRKQPAEQSALFAKSDRLSDAQVLWLTNDKTELPLKKGRAYFRLDTHLGLVITIEKGDE